MNLRGRNYNSFPLWEEFVWKDSCRGGEEDSFAFKVEEF